MTWQMLANHRGLSKQAQLREIYNYWEKNVFTGHLGPGWQNNICYFKTMQQLCSTCASNTREVLALNYEYQALNLGSRLKTVVLDRPHYFSWFLQNRKTKWGNGKILKKSNKNQNTRPLAHYCRKCSNNEMLSKFVMLKQKESAHMLIFI